jgi:hypothetical protein
MKFSNEKWWKLIGQMPPAQEKRMNFYAIVFILMATLMFVLGYYHK